MMSTRSSHDGGAGMPGRRGWMPRWLSIPLIGLLALVGCVARPDYYYAPEAATVTRTGIATQIKRIPDEAPQGSVEISSVGITEPPRGGRALHVRMTVNNEGDDTPWRVDIRDQAVQVSGAGRSQPEFASSDVQTLPTVEVPRHERRVLDLYFPVPPGVHDAADLPAFDFQWQVATGSRTVSDRTRVARFEVERPTVYVASWGPYWWYHPWYPHVAYRAVYVAPVVVHRW